MAAPYNANGFTGKVYDAKAGLMDFGARWYSTDTARFTSADTFAGYADQPLSLNQYSYTYNNPVNFVDPTGRYAVPQEGGSSWSGQTLRQGDEGSYVMDLQSMLKDVEFNPGTVDGIFGPNTEDSVISFQRAAGISVDGVAGEQTYNALLNYGKGSGDSGGSSGGGKIENWMGQLLRRGDSGPMVEDLQNMLKDAGFSPGAVDGIFGDDTYDAVRRFQDSVGIKVDGLAGRETYKKLINKEPWKEESSSNMGQIGNAKQGKNYLDLVILKDYDVELKVDKGIIEFGPGKIIKVGKNVIKIIDNAYDIAKNGGKHSGFYKQYINKTFDQIQKGIKSLEKQIDEHLEKITNPEKHIPNFKKLDPRQQEALINKKWTSDIQRQMEQKHILEGILKNKKR